MFKVSRSSYKFPVVHTLYGACIQISASILYDPKRSRPVIMLLYLCDCIILLYFIILIF